MHIKMDKFLDLNVYDKNILLKIVNFCQIYNYFIFYLY
jgi:hypothetical protein